MARKLRIAVTVSVTLAGLVLASLWVAYYAVRHVRPFYEKAVQLDPEVLAERSREMESRATALYSDTRKPGVWQALFTDEQINGWLAVQLAESQSNEAPPSIYDPRIAIADDVLTLGFRATRGGMESVITVDASVFLTETGAVAIRLRSVRAGALPLPVMQVADEISAACQRLSLPVRWTQQEGEPIALIEISNDEDSKGRRLYLETIELKEGELFLAGRTEIGEPTGPIGRHSGPGRPGPSIGAGAEDDAINLDEYELRLTPRDERSALEIARRPKSMESEPLAPAER